MDQFPDNSKYSAPAEAKKKDIKPVVLTPVHTQKRPLGTRLKEMFIGGDAKSTWQGVVVDVLLPAAKDTMLDAVTQGAERMLFGESRGTFRRPGGMARGGVVHTAYNRMYGNTTAMPRETAGPRTAANAPTRGTRSSTDFGEIVMGTRAEAQEVLSQMYTLLSEYEQVSVADLYQLVNMEPGTTDFKWGWTSLTGSDVRRLREGYALNLPRVEPL